MSNLEEMPTLLNLGPEKADKIALLGTAQSSMELAPFRDPSWAIWACSPGAYSVCAKNRSDVWFEPHRWLPTAPGQFGAPGTKPWFSSEFHQFLRDHKGPVFMTGDPRILHDKEPDPLVLVRKYGRPEPSIPNSLPIPYGALVDKFGPYFWQSTICYMLAMAINAGPKAIGLWGIDMSASEEYAYQRPACQHFIGLAKSAGIDIVLPAESDLMRPSTMYGIGEYNPRHIKLMARRAEILANKQNCDQTIGRLQMQSSALAGQLAECDYILSTWSDDVNPDVSQALSFAGTFVKPVQESTGAAVLEIDRPIGEAGKH